MALTYLRVVEEANALAALCNEVASLEARINQVLEHNSDLAIDWTAGSTPSYITEDGAGNLSGLPYTRQQVGTAISSLDWIRKLLTNQSMTGSQGDHLGIINLLSRPLG
jgi:hypothetical protein